MKIEEFLKSLQGVTVDDLAPDEVELLKGVLGDVDPEPEAEPATAEGLLAKAVAGLTDLVKSMKGKPAEKPEDDDEDEADEDEDSAADKAEDEKEDEEDEEDEDRLEEAVKDLTAGLDKEEKVKKSMEHEVTVEDLAKSLLDQYRDENTDTEQKQNEVITDLAKAVKAQGETIEGLRKSLADMGSRPVPTLTPFELRKAIDTVAGQNGLPARDAAVAVMQKAFEHCTQTPDAVPMNKAITATDVQAVEDAYAHNNAEWLEGVKPLLARAESIVGQ
jgi:hypothetical protein